MAAKRGVVPPTFRGKPRVVGAIRLSKYTDASTSPEVQEEMITRVGERIGGEFVGWAPDTDVSALKTTPWEREQLSYWLNRPDEWDVIIWQRMDRAVRSMADMADLGRFAKKHGKRLIFASGPGGDMLELDFASPMSELIMLILAFAAQLEGQTIMERNQGAAAHLESLGRWAGGPIPYGWKPGKKTFEDGNEGWWLFLHTDEDPAKSTSDIRRGMIARAISESYGYSEIKRWLEDVQAITPKNNRALLATPPRELDPESQWNVTVVREMLLSDLNRGYLTKRDGTVVRDNDGAPILQAEPLIDDETARQLKQALRSLDNGNHAPRSDGHEFLDVLVCAVCKHNMTQSWYHETKGKGKNRVSTGRRIGVFRCNGVHHEKGVPGLGVRQNEVREWVEAEFLAHMAPLKRTQVMTIPGIDHRAEIQELEETIKDLSARLARLSGPAADAVESQLVGRSNRLVELRAVPFVPPREEVVELEETWAETWADTPDWRQRGRLLRSVGVRVEVSPAQGWRPSISDRLVMHIGTHVDPEQDALDDVAYQESL